MRLLAPSYIGLGNELHTCTLCNGSHHANVTIVLNDIFVESVLQCVSTTNIVWEVPY